MNLIKSLFSPVYSITRAAVALVIGLAMIIWPALAVYTVFRVIGAALIVLGAASVALAIVNHTTADALVMASGVLDIIFGLLLVIYPGFFAGLLMYFLGAVMLVFGVGQIVNLAVLRRTVPVAIWWFVLPFAIAVLGIVMICNTFKAQETLFIVFGISLIAYAATEIAATACTRRAEKVLKQTAVQSAAAEILREEASDAEEI